MHRSITVVICADRQPRYSKLPLNTSFIFNPSTGHKTPIQPLFVQELVLASTTSTGRIQSGRSSQTNSELSCMGLGSQSVRDQHVGNDVWKEACSAEDPYPPPNFYPRSRYARAVHGTHAWFSAIARPRTARPGNRLLSQLYLLMVVLPPVVLVALYPRGVPSCLQATRQAIHLAPPPLFAEPRSCGPVPELLSCSHCT